MVAKIIFTPTNFSLSSPLRIKKKLLRFLHKSHQVVAYVNYQNIDKMVKFPHYRFVLFHSMRLKKCEIFYTLTSYTLVKNELTMNSLNISCYLSNLLIVGKCGESSKKTHVAVSPRKKLFDCLCNVNIKIHIYKIILLNLLQNSVLSP